MTAAETVPGPKATPILFSAPMIRALLEGRKTQTRRPVKGTALDWLDAAGFDPAFVAASENGLCPYGSPGDLLWCRETWQLHTRAIDTGKVVYRASENASHTEFHRLVPVGLMGNTQPKPFQEGWRSPLHMPRWASRLALDLTGVRVERLQNIGEQDAVAEGATSRPNCSGFLKLDDGWSMDWSNVGRPSRFAADGNLAESEVCLATAQSAFGAFINELHGGHNWNLRVEKPLWDQNPWVWALSFRVHQQNIDALLDQRRAA